jgi:hypothetical protein
MRRRPHRLDWVNLATWALIGTCTLIVWGLAGLGAAWLLGWLA